MTARGLGRLSRPSRVAIVGTIVLTGLAALARFGDGATRSDRPDGPQSSTLSTGANGTAALRELLAVYGVPVSDQRAEIGVQTLDSDTTFVVVDGTPLDSTEVDEVHRFVAAGGRLIVAGSAPWSERIWDGPLPDRSAGEGNTDATPTPTPTPAPTPGPSGAESVEGRVGGEPFTVHTDDGFVFTAGAESSDAGANLVAEQAVERGLIRWIADSSALSNRRLATADNAGFALSVIGTDRPVVFAEGVHGFGRVSGIAAVPSRWRFAIVGGALAALLTLLAAGRRLGPPEVKTRALPPARLAYVEAVGSLLSRARRPNEALAPAILRLQEAVAAERMTLTADEVQALYGPLDRPLDTTRILAIGHLLARAGRRGALRPGASVVTKIPRVNPIRPAPSRRGPA